MYPDAVRAFVIEAPLLVMAVEPSAEVAGFAHVKELMGRGTFRFFGPFGDNVDCPESLEFGVEGIDRELIFDSRSSVNMDFWHRFYLPVEMRRMTGRRYSTNAVTRSISLGARLYNIKEGRRHSEGTACEES